MELFQQYRKKLLHINVESKIKYTNCFWMCVRSLSEAEKQKLVEYRKKYNTQKNKNAS